MEFTLKINQVLEKVFHNKLHKTINPTGGGRPGWTSSDPGWTTSGPTSNFFLRFDPG